MHAEHLHRRSGSIETLASNCERASEPFPRQPAELRGQGSVALSSGQQATVDEHTRREEAVSVHREAPRSHVRTGELTYFVSVRHRHGEEHQIAVARV